MGSPEMPTAGIKMIWSKRACSSPIQTAQLRSLPRCGHARISGCRQSARVNLNGLPFSIGPAGALPVAQRTTAASEVIADRAGGTICVAPRPPPTPFPIAPGSPNVPTPKGAADDGGPLHETRSFGCDLKRRSDGHREDAARRCGGRERNCYGRGRKDALIHSVLQRLSPVAPVPVMPAPIPEPRRVPFARPIIGRHETRLRASPKIRP